MTSLSFLEAQNPVRIYTYAYNRPDFLEIQHACLQKYMLDPFTLVVFNDASEPKTYEAIHQVCRKRGLRCVDMPQHLHQSQRPSARNAAVVNYSLEIEGFDYEGIVVLLDSDMFLVKEINVSTFMERSCLKALFQERSNNEKTVDYLWVGIVFIDMQNLPDKRQLDFGEGAVEGVATDTGGRTHLYLATHRELKVEPISLVYTKDVYRAIVECPCSFCQTRGSMPCLESLERFKEFEPAQILYIKESLGDNSEFYLDSHFFHYRCGSNWSQKEKNYRAKIKAFGRYMSSFLPNKASRSPNYERKA